MNNNDIAQKVMEQILNMADSDETKCDEKVPEYRATSPLLSETITEFVGTGFGNTIGMVIANVDDDLHERLKLDKKYHSLGIISARTGAGPQAMAADEAVKATNTEVVIFEMPRDTEGGGGHGIFLVFGGEEVSDVRRAVEVALDSLDHQYCGGIAFTDPGFMECQYTARASQCLADFLGADLGKAWGFFGGCPAGIGLVMADAAMKSANVNIVRTFSPAHGTSYSNEYLVAITGDSGAVKQAIISAREVGAKLLETMGGKPLTPGGKPYIY